MHSDIQRRFKERVQLQCDAMESNCLVSQRFSATKIKNQICLIQAFSDILKGAVYKI